MIVLEGKLATDIFPYSTRTNTFPTTTLHYEEKLVIDIFSSMT